LLTEHEEDDWKQTRPPLYNGSLQESAVSSEIEPDPLGRVLGRVTLQFNGKPIEVEFSSGGDLNLALKKGLIDTTRNIHVLSTQSAPPAELIVSEDDDEAGVQCIEHENLELFRMMLLRADAEMRNQSSAAESNSLKANLVSVNSGDPIYEQQIELSASLRIMSWNINGIRSLVGKNDSLFVKENGGEKTNSLAIFLERERLDVLCLQETRQANFNDMPVGALNPAGYSSFWSSCVTTRGYSGLGIYVRRGLATKVVEGFPEAPQFNDEARVMTVHIGHEIVVVNIYSPNIVNRDDQRISYKREFLQCLREYIHTLSVVERNHVIVAGDFNVVYRDQDIWNPDEMNNFPPMSPMERESMMNIFNVGFVDAYLIAHPDGNEFTTWRPAKFARENNEGFRLDFFLTPMRSASRIISCDVRADIPGSDHAAITLEYATDVIPRVDARNIQYFGKSQPLDVEVPHLDLKSLFATKIKRAWQLNPRVFHTLNELYGPFEVDLFATAGNSQLPRYCSIDPTDKRAYAL
jgi:exodeoxyribonuclease-3